MQYILTKRVEDMSSMSGSIDSVTGAARRGRRRSSSGGRSKVKGHVTTSRYKVKWQYKVCCVIFTYHTQRQSQL